MSSESSESIGTSRNISSILGKLNRDIDQLWKGKHDYVENALVITVQREMKPVKSSMQGISACTILSGTRYIQAFFHGNCMPH